MNYLKLYIKLMRKAKSRDKLNGYYEKHHIFPISLFGKNNYVVFLTAKEHYIAHFILWKLCKQRYGINSLNTNKMHFAFNQMTWNQTGKRYVSKTFTIAREAASVYNSGNNNPSKNLNVRQKISLSKVGKKRLDMKGKKYFGASLEKIKSGIDKMVKTKTGKSVNYPKKRRSAECSINKANKISEARKKTSIKYMSMTKEEFKNWLNSQQMYTKRGSKNSNITRAIMWRGESINEYY